MHITFLSLVVLLSLYYHEVTEKHKTDCKTVATAGTTTEQPSSACTRCPPPGWYGTRHSLGRRQRQGKCRENQTRDNETNRRTERERGRLKWACWEQSSLEAHSSGRADTEGPCSDAHNLAPADTNSCGTDTINSRMS